MKTSLHLRRPGYYTHEIVKEFDWHNVVSQVQYESKVKCVCMYGLTSKAQTAVCGVNI